MAAYRKSSEAREALLALTYGQFHWSQAFWTAETPSKSPFSKGGFRGIFNV